MSLDADATPCGHPRAAMTSCPYCGVAYGSGALDDRARHRAELFKMLRPMLVLPEVAAGDAEAYARALAEAEQSVTQLVAGSASSSRPACTWTGTPRSRRGERPC